MTVGYGKSVFDLIADGVIDTRGILTSENDAATVCWGNKWRMPTNKEFQELIDECAWIKIYNDEVKGYKVIGRNNNFIFFARSWTFF